MALVLSLGWIIFLVRDFWLINRVQSMWNRFILFSLNLIFQTSTDKAAPWAGFFTSVFLFILFLNLTSLLPYGFAKTSHLSFTLCLGFPFWLGVKVYGFYTYFSRRLRHLVPQGTPFYLIPFMVLIETLRLFVQPLALGLRLAAKLIAGHMLIRLITATIWNFILIKWVCLSLVLILLLLLLFMLEVAVSCIQAYVYVALLYYYLQENN